MLVKLFKITVMFGMILSTGSFATRNDGSMPKRPKIVKKEFSSYTDCIDTMHFNNPGSKKADFNLLCNYLHPIK